jgi:beta-lactamase class A
MASKRKNSLEPKWVLVFVFFVAGAFMGGLCTYLYTNAALPNMVKLHYPKGTFAYTNPTIVSDPASTAPLNTASQDLALKLQGVIDKSKKTGVAQVGLYYRDLEPATWLDINSGMQFSPGTLLKVPIMITYFKMAEANPSILTTQLTFTGSYPKTNELFLEPPALARGRSYSIDDLISKMTVNYDNAAANILFEHVDKNLLNETFSNLGIDFNEDNVNADFISIRRYSLFFRVLYNATYLSPEYSEKALALLAQNSPNTLLQSQLPQSIRFVSRSGGHVTHGGVEVYECDIVYYPNHDYLLCAAAQGATQEAVTALLSQLGQTVYADTAYRYPN